ncbi:MAG: M20/M25/M40 family metallo-hydrolase [Gemmatimonadales bacterium]|nr:M20/M25/M40 family metallo-hydrolase [Gemmatimonadales bacterium]NIN48605.1 M20/M25/M40 family metallo-hydrolase [Gemmatimonadales bacterium]NIP06069.1 M20/M25/M40 family metallo-hydrolase [Gemmatimonadales bacterium]NIR01243.1 M20/M25/M40 family metallo-hydrolase [Gemmatimonadales bacterium]
MLAPVVAGAGLGWAALALSPLLVIAVPGWAVALVGAGALGLVALVAHGVLQGYLPVPATAVAATNLVGRRGTPALWLVAHLDSKSQGVSLRGRVVAVANAMLGLTGLLILLAFRVSGPVPWWAALVVTALAVVGGGALSLGAPRNRSPGAVDNATGVVAVIAAAECLDHRRDVGVLLTGAEEFGMEGARSWAASGDAIGAFINFDGIDSRGRYRLQRHAAAREAEPVPSSHAIVRAVAAALSAEGRPVVVRPLPLGTFVDGAVLAQAGMPGVTVSRGDWATLGVVHTERDAADRVDVAAAVQAGAAAARAVDTLLG